MFYPIDTGLLYREQIEFAIKDKKFCKPVIFIKNGGMLQMSLTYTQLLTLGQAL